MAGVFKSLGNLFKKMLAWVGIELDKLGDTDALNQALVEQQIKEQREAAEKANYANGQLASQIYMLKEQLQRQQRSKAEYEAILKDCVARNDEEMGGEYAEQLATIEQEIEENQHQLDVCEQNYQQNKTIIANCIREVQRFKREFDRVKVKVAVSRQMQGMAEMMKSSISELEGMLGGEASQAMESLRKAAAEGQGQMRATMDMAKEMGANVMKHQEVRKARGRSLFAEYKSKFGMVQADGAKITSSDQVGASKQSQKQSQKKAVTESN